MKKQFVVSFFFILSQIATSQKIEAWLDSTTINFANQTYLRIKVTTQTQNRVVFPIYDDTISRNIEIVEISKTDTLSKTPFVVQKNYLITSFKDSLQLIAPIPVIVGNDTLFTQPLQLMVLPFRIDSNLVKTIDTNQLIRIFDIKPVLVPKFTFKEFWIFYGRYILLAIVLVVSIYFLVRFLRKIYKKSPQQVVSKTQEPAHIIALRQIAELKNKKYLQQGMLKEYYSELSFIIRQYIENRYYLPALERTSTEILEDFTLIKQQLAQNDYEMMRQILNISDLVKFAKFIPSIDTAERNLEMLEQFINNTKLVIQSNETTQSTDQPKS